MISVPAARLALAGTPYACNNYCFYCGLCVVAAGILLCKLWGLNAGVDHLWRPVSFGKHALDALSKTAYCWCTIVSGAGSKSAASCPMYGRTCRARPAHAGDSLPISPPGFEPASPEAQHIDDVVLFTFDVGHWCHRLQCKHIHTTEMNLILAARNERRFRLVLPCSIAEASHEVSS